MSEKYDGNGPEWTRGATTAGQIDEQSSDAPVKLHAVPTEQESDSNVVTRSSEWFETARTVGRLSSTDLLDQSHGEIALALSKIPDISPDTPIASELKRLFISLGRPNGPRH